MSKNKDMENAEKAYACILGIWASAKHGSAKQKQADILLTKIAWLQKIIKEENDF